MVPDPLQWVLVVPYTVTVGVSGPVHRYSGEYTKPGPRTHTRRCTTHYPRVRTTPLPGYPSPPHRTLHRSIPGTRDRLTHGHGQECQFSRKWCQRGAANNHCRGINGTLWHARRDCLTFLTKQSKLMPKEAAFLTKLSILRKTRLWTHPLMTRLWTHPLMTRLWTRW